MVTTGHLVLDLFWRQTVPIKYYTVRDSADACGNPKASMFCFRNIMAIQLNHMIS